MHKNKKGVIQWFWIVGIILLIIIFILFARIKNTNIFKIGDCVIGKNSGIYGKVTSIAREDLFMSNLVGRWKIGVLSTTTPIGQSVSYSNYFTNTDLDFSSKC